MARATKRARHISVDDVAYHWRATGDDGWIALCIWPAALPGPVICTSFGYHETWVPHGGGCWTSLGDQIVITNRLVRRVIDHARLGCGYDARRAGKQLTIGDVESHVVVSDAVYATAGGLHG